MGAAALKELTWTDVDSASADERNIILYAIGGVEPKQIAKVTRRSLDKVNQVLTYPPAVEYIEAQLACANAEELGRLDSYEENVDKFLKLQTKMLNAALYEDDEGKWKPQVTEATMRKLLDNVPKHDPKGTFAPTSKQEVKKEVNVVATAQILELREETLAPHMRGDSKPRVSSNYRQVLDAEFEEVRVHGPGDSSETKEQETANED